jgi:hypothetical protein
VWSTTDVAERDYYEDGFIKCLKYSGAVLHQEEYGEKKLYDYY